MNRLGASDVIRMLGLERLVREGGFFRETYRSRVRVPGAALPDHPAERSLSTAIYYLLTPDSFSALHRVRGDEIFHFYMGDPVEMLQLRAGGGGERVILGNALAEGMKPQVVVDGGVWQGARLVPGGAFALLGTTMAPGFDSADFELGDRDDLSRAFPAHAKLIGALTALDSP